MNIKLKTLSIAVLLMASPALGQTWVEINAGRDYAGAAEITAGAGDLTSITGGFNISNGGDLYAIRVADPGAFHISLIGGATFDTRLFLFNIDGELVVWNDNFGGTTQSELTNQGVCEPGLYYLCVINGSNEPMNANGDLLASSDTWPGPDAQQRRGIASLGPVDAWTNPGTGVGGTNNYTVTLTGCAFARDLAGEEDHWVPNDYATIQDAVNAALDGDTIHITPGTFLESGIDLGDKTLHLRGAGMDHSVIDAQLAGRVFERDQIGDGSVIKRLTLTRGSSGSGGAVRNNVSVSFTECRFLDNVATGLGGDLVINNGATVWIDRCEFIGATTPQAAVQIQGDGTQGRIVDCLFQGITSTGIGTLVVLAGGDVNIDRCRFLNNQANVGQVLADGDGSLVKIINCLFDGNTGLNGEAVVTCQGDARCEVISSTIVGNTSGLHDALRERGTGRLVVSNTIMFNNPGGDFGAGVDVTRSIFSGAGGDNLDVDPMFVDSANGDYRLLAGSPAIDAGDSRHPMLMGSGAADLGGNARLLDDLAIADTGVADATSVVDIGAFEGGCALLAPAACPGDINGDGIVDAADLGILLGAFGGVCN